MHSLTPSPPSQMNVRQLCFFRVAKASGQPWLWWDYTNAFGDSCSMATNNFTADCAQKVPRAMSGA